MGGKQTSTTTNTSSPWEPAQAPLKTGLVDAQKLYQAGVGGQVNTMSNVTPMAQQTTAAYDSMGANAQANMNGNGISGQYGSVIGAGGYNPMQVRGTDAFQSVVSQSMQPSFSEKNLAGVANGEFLNRADPNFERALGAASSAAANEVNLGASAAGRYGSGIHQGNVARTVGDMQAQARVGQYNQERANQMAANQMLDSSAMARMGMNINAGQNLFNAGQQGFNNLASAYQGMNAPAQDMLRIGSAYEDLMSRQINDRNRIFDAQQNAPWDQIARLNAVAGGAGRMGGTSSGTATQPGQSPFGSILGGLLSL